MVREHEAVGMRYPREITTTGCGTDVPVVPPSASGIAADRDRFRRSPVSLRLLSSLLLSIFMVVVLPACFYGGLLRAEVVQTSNNGNNEEHREHHEERAEEKTVAIRSRTHVAVRRPTRPVRVRIQPVALPRLADPYIPHPSRFSERRLI